MRRFAILGVLVFESGCARWAYGPTWRAVEHEAGVALTFESEITCGTLSVANETNEPVSVVWSDVHVLLPWGERRETKLWAEEGAHPPEDTDRIGVGERMSAGLCADLRLFVLRPRPATAYDFALDWFFGAGVIAGNIRWRPDEQKRDRVIPAPDAYGWDLVVPLVGSGTRREATLAVKGDRVTAFKYTSWAHGEPEDLEQTRVP